MNIHEKIQDAALSFQFSAVVVKRILSEHTDAEQTEFFNSLSVLEANSLDSIGVEIPEKTQSVSAPEVFHFAPNAADINLTKLINAIEAP